MTLLEKAGCEGFALSKINQIAAIDPPPPEEINHSIKNSLARFINAGAYHKSTKELSFAERLYKSKATESCFSWKNSNSKFCRVKIYN